MTLLEIPLHLIKTSPYQMRELFDEIELEELAESIARYGLLQPLLLRPSLGESYELISGERRWRALKKIGAKAAPALIRRGEGEERLPEMALTENIQRAPLTPLEVARGYQALLRAFSLTQEELSRRLSKPRSTIANFLRLLQLPPKIQRALEEERISMGHAKALLALEGRPQERLFSEILKEKLSVRGTEAKRGGKREELHLTALERELSAKLGERVTLSKRGEGGSLCLKWRDLDELLELLGAKEPC